MTPTITDYRPGIYAELARRAEARRHREERMLRRIDTAADCLLGGIALTWLAWAAWFTLGCFAP